MDLECLSGLEDYATTVDDFVVRFRLLPDQLGTPFQAIVNCPTVISYDRAKEELGQHATVSGETPDRRQAYFEFAEGLASLGVVERFASITWVSVQRVQVENTQGSETIRRVEFRNSSLDFENWALARRLRRFFLPKSSVYSHVARRGLLVFALNQKDQEIAFADKPASTVLLPPPTNDG